jgi:PKD repeat protein
MKKAKYIFGVFLLVGMLGILKAQNAMISGKCKSGLQAANKNENAIASYEYAKVGEEGFRNRDAQEIIEKTTFTDCEPVWWYWSFNNVPGGAFVEGKSEWTFPNGTVNTYDFFDGPAPPTGWAWFRYSNHFDNLSVGTHTWKVYEKSSNGAYVLKSTKTITVNPGSSGLSCAQRMYLPLDGNTQDISGSGNHAIHQGGTAVYGSDRFGNCNAALRINGGKYLEAPVINERAVSLWFKLNQQDQMVIYDSGPNEFESKDFKIGVFKPNGLYGSPSFDNSTFGVFFNTWDRDIAVPFDAVKSGWHHIIVSRVSDGFERFRIMIDGQFPSGYMWDGFPTVQQWVAQNQPFALPPGGYGVPNLFDTNYKTYMGKDFQQTNELFDGWLDEVRVFNQLLDVSEMMSLYNASNTSGLTLTTSSTPACNGSSNGSATVSNISGGTPPYAYAWSNGQTTSTAVNLTSGTYTVTVTSNGACSPTTASVNVGSSTNPTATITLTTPTCPNQSNGAATVTVTGGTGPYTYHWSNNQNTATATGLAAGAYTVTVTSGNGCSATAIATVGTSPSPSATIGSMTNACPNQSNGAATVTATGGTSPYTFHWSNNQNTATATGLAAGTYTVTVTSATGCTTTATASIINNPPTQAAFSFTANNNTLTFTNTSTNATSYLWNFGDGQTSTQVSPTHTYTSPNNYVICLTGTGVCGSTTVCDTVLLAPPGWNPTPCNTGIVHTIGVQSDVVTNISGQQLEPGDLVGFFYTDQSGATVCNNMGAWTGSALVLEVCGDNPATANVKEGYGTGENFIVKVWKGGTEYSVVACFVPEDAYGANNPSATGSFVPFGLSYIDCLKTPSDPGADLGCDSPIPIACGETKTGNNDSGASNANTYSCFSNLVDGPEVVYQFVNTASQNVLITLTGLQSDLELLMLRPCDRNDCLAYSDRTGTSPEAIFLENLAPGTYFIVVEGYLGSSSNYTLNIQCGAAGNGNLNCANATPINCGQSLQGSVVSGTNQVVQWACSPAYTSGKERIYSFVSNEDKYAFASLTGLTADVDLFILDACDPNNCITSSNKSGTENEAVIFHAPPGKQFYIVVDGYFGAEGSFTLSIPCVDPCQDPADCPYEIGGPGNTQIINAQSLQCGVPVTGNNANGQANASYYSCPGGFTNGKEVVYKFENPVAQDITIVLSGMAANLDLYLLSGPSIFNCHSASHKSGTSDEGIVVQALPSGTYYIVVDGYNGATSGYNLVINCSNSTLNCQTIDLVQGTNFVSSNIVPLDPAIEVLFPSSAQSKIISIESQANLSYSPYAQTDPAVFGDWDFRKAYRIKALEAVSIEVCGEKADPATPIPFVAQTPQGQPVNNWSAYLPEDAALVGDKFTPTLTPKIYRVWNMPTNTSGTLTPQSWSVTLQSGNNYQMNPGHGYILNASEDGEYSFGFWNGDYAEGRAKNAAPFDFVENGCSYYRVMPYNSLHAATILIQKEAMGLLQIGDEIGVFKPDGTLIGSGKYNGFSLSIVVTGDEAATLDFSEGFLEGEQMMFKSWSSEEGRELELKASFDTSDDAFHDDKVYFVKALEQDNTMASHHNMPAVEWSVYPNPVRESAIIDIKLSEASRVHIQLISPNGVISQTFVEADMPAGRKVLNVKTAGLNAGYYLLRMTTPQGVSFKKIVISKN